MKTLDIKQKLEQIDVTLEAINLGEFDMLGEYTAKRTRSPDNEYFKKVGATYRSNYERGILIYYLIRQFNLTSFLEVGFGRGYATLCASKAFYDAGIQGSITTIDPALDEKFLNALSQVIPHELFKPVKFVKDTSMNALPKLDTNFDFAYIDGDHSYLATKIDWEGVKTKVNKFVLFDDYHPKDTKQDSGIQCQEAIDEIDWEKEGFNEPELIIMDRKLFPDDKYRLGEDIKYGQVLVEKK